MRQTGQWLRLIGMLIEMIGVVGVVREGRAPTISWAWIAVGVGFGLFLVGRILLAAAGPRRGGSQS
jgi:hypothetical protein